MKKLKGRNGLWEAILDHYIQTGAHFDVVDASEVEEDQVLFDIRSLARYPVMLVKLDGILPDNFQYVNLDEFPPQHEEVIRIADIQQSGDAFFYLEPKAGLNSYLELRYEEMMEELEGDDRPARIHIGFNELVNPNLPVCLAKLKYRYQIATYAGEAVSIGNFPSSREEQREKDAEGRFEIATLDDGTTIYLRLLDNPSLEIIIAKR